MELTAEYVGLPWDRKGVAEGEGNYLVGDDTTGKGRLCTGIRPKGPVPAILGKRCLTSVSTRRVKTVLCNTGGHESRRRSAFRAVEGPSCCSGKRL